MMQQVTDIAWADVEIAIPAFLTIVLMPFTYSITVGIGAGFLAFLLIKLVVGKARDDPPADGGRRRRSSSSTSPSTRSPPGYLSLHSAPSRRSRGQLRLRRLGDFSEVGTGPGARNS